MSDSDLEQEFDRRLTAIEEKVAQAIPQGADVQFSAYELDDQELPIDNLDKVAVEGRCIFVQECDPHIGNGKNYVSGEYVNPTWIQVCWIANEMIQVTDNRHAIFLEGVSVLREQNGVKIVDLDMGS
jgi:hypothetical protein